MKRSYASQLVEIFSENIQKLNELGVVSNNLGFPDYLMGSFKILMTIHADYLRILFDRLIQGSSIDYDEDNFETLSNDVLKEATKRYFTSPVYAGITFNHFWDNLLAQNSISAQDSEHYHFTKIQTCFIWQAMHSLFNSFIADDPSYYQIKADCFDENDILKISSSNVLLDRALKLYSNNPYVPQCAFWKDSTELVHQAFSNTYPKAYLPLSKDKNTTLHDVWVDGYLLSNQIGSKILVKPILFFNIDNRLAHALSNLISRYLNIIKILGSPYDFKNDIWDEDASTKQEIEKLNSLNLELTLNLTNLTNTIARQQETIQIQSETTSALTTQNLDLSQKLDENELVYSKNPIELQRQRIGEQLQDTPIIIPNNVQAKKHPNCLCIIQDLGLVESTIRNWSQECQEKGLGFWMASDLRDRIVISNRKDQRRISDTLYTRIRNGLTNSLSRKN